MLITEVKRKLEAPGVKSAARGRENSEVWLSSARLQVRRRTSCEWGTHLEMWEAGTHMAEEQKQVAHAPPLAFPPNRSINVNFKKNIK